MHCEDEDVVMCRSPLGQYLEEVTDDDYTQYSPRPLNEHNDTASKVLETHSGSKLVSNVGFIMNKFMPGKVADTFDVIHSCYLLLNSCLLSEEDENLLIDLAEVVQNLSKAHECTKKGTNRCINKEVTCCILVLIFIVLSFLVLESRSMNDAIACIITLVLIFPLLYYVKLKELLQDIPNDLLINVQLFCDSFGGYNSLIDKVICHIRETEVIMNGYPQIHMFSSSLPRRGEKCLKLRCCLKDGLTDLFNRLRVNTRILLGNRRNDLAFDYKEEHIAVLSLDTFSEVFYSSDENGGCVDTTPLGKLKSIVCLYRLQMSEYVYMIIVSLFGFHHDDIKKYAKDVLFSLEDMNRSILNTSKLLEEQLNISVKLIFQKEEKVQEKKTQSQSSVADILHSSEIHLHTALGRIEDMKVLFEQNSSELKDLPSLDVLNSLSTQFSLSLENAKFCVEEIIEKNQPCTNQTMSSPVENIDVSDDTEGNYVLLPSPPVEEGDMLYEGESECRDSSKQCIMTDADIENSLKESRESRKLMRELKTILSVKDSPVGLIPFPLKKTGTDDDHSDAEYSCGEEVFAKRAEDKQIFNSAYVYDPDSADDSELDNNTLSLPIMQQVGLPAISRRCNMEEETFGCSTDEELDTQDVPDVPEYT